MKKNKKRVIWLLADKKTGRIISSPCDTKREAVFKKWLNEKPVKFIEA